MSKFHLNDKADILKENILVLPSSNSKRTFTLYDANNLISYYKKGLIKSPDGVNVKINDDNTITLTISETFKTDEIEFSIILGTKIGETTSYVSNYEKQTLTDFKLINPKFSTLKIIVNEPEPEPQPPQKALPHTGEKKHSLVTISSIVLLLIVSCINFLKHHKN